MRTPSERGTRNRHRTAKIFLERFGPYIEKMLIKILIFHDPDEIGIRRPFYRSFSTFWTWHSNIMSNNGLNLIDQCAAECVHLCPPEE